MSLFDQPDLFFPHSYRIVAEYMPQGIILCGRHRKLQQATDEIRHDRAAATGLDLQMPRARHGHVVGKIEMLKPLHLPVQHGGSKALGPYCLSVQIDTSDPS